MNSHVYLYVEDDSFSRQALEIVLKQLMKIEHVHIFEDSRDFMTRLRGLPNKPDIILLDIHMRPHTGFEMLQMLRRDEDYKNSRVVALTASVMSDEVALLKSSGFDGVIGKPINISSFPSLLQRIIAGESIWHVTDWE